MEENEINKIQKEEMRKEISHDIKAKGCDVKFPHLSLLSLFRSVSG